jgi:hypothetical protein
MQDAPAAKPTQTQPRPNISTEHPQGADAGEYKPTSTQPAPNISTEHQAAGDARRPSDGLDRGQPAQPDGDRKSSLTHDA